MANEITQNKIFLETYGWVMDALSADFGKISKGLKT